MDFGRIAMLGLNMLEVFALTLRGAWISHFETIAFMCGDMVRALVCPVVIGLVC